MTMKKMVCVILGLAFLALGFLGITGWVTMFQSNTISVNIGEIVLGILGFAVGIYARQGVEYAPQKAMSSKQVNDIDLQRKEIDQQRKDIDQQRKDIDQQKKDITERLAEKNRVKTETF
jgi:5-bromo-4-chloroindolyl phosphate hydrolysis protein